MIVDTHCHCWPRWPYARAADAPPIDVHRHGSAERLRETMTAAGISHALIVAAGIGDPPIDDNAYALEAARRHPGSFSVVADVDSKWSATHHDGRMADRIRALPDAPALAGVSHYLADETDDWMASPEAGAAGAALTERRMLLSLHAPPAWHAAVGGWAQRHPEVPVLLHHLGLVRDQRELDGLLALAEVPSIIVKASGFAYIDPSGAPPYPAGVERLRAVVEAFGPDRVAWGSDFPVSPEHGVGIDRALGLVRDAVGARGASASEAIMGATAHRLLSRRHA